MSTNPMEAPYRFRPVGPGRLEVISVATGRVVCCAPSDESEAILSMLEHAGDDASVEALAGVLLLAQEHRQVAALVCLDLDVLHEVAVNGGASVDIARQIEHAWKKKEEVIADEKVRRSRYESARLLFRLSASAAEQRLCPPEPEGDSDGS